MPRVVILNDTALTENHHGCHAVMSALEDLLVRRSISVELSVPLGTNWERPEIVSAIRRSDALIINGEGTLHSSRPYVKNLLRAGSFASSLGRPAILINSVYQNNDSEVADLVREFNLVSVRESFSQAELSSENIDSAVVPDLTFWSTRSVAQEPKHSSVRKYSIPVVTDSVDKSKTAILHEYAERKNLSKCLIYVPDISRLSSLKHEIGDWIKFGKSNPPAFVHARNANSFIKKLSRFPLVLSGRFHVTCFAISHSIPFFCIGSNSHKVEGMLADAGLQDRLTDPCSLPEIDAINSWTEEHSAKCEEYSSSAVGKISDLFDTIREMM